MRCGGGRRWWWWWWWSDEGNSGIVGSEERGKGWRRRKGEEAQERRGEGETKDREESWGEEGKV